MSKSMNALALGITLSALSGTVAQATPLAACQIKMLAIASTALAKAYPEKAGTMGRINEVSFNLHDTRPKVVLFGRGVGEKQYCLMQVLMTKPAEGACPEVVEEFDVNCP